MTSLKMALRAAGLPALMLAFAACDSAQPTVTNAESPESNAGLVFTESFADAGTFTISKNPLGGYNYFVQARIGSKAEAIMNASANVPTLAGVYQSLHEGKTEMPAIVSEASAWLKSQPSSDLEKERVIPAPMPLEKSASQSAFTNGYCKDFIEGIYRWRWMSCVWKAANNQTTSGGVYGNGATNDRVYAWNNTAYLATLRLWNTNFTGYANTWAPTLNPYSVTWFSWGGTYTNANAVIALPSGLFGEIALSNHAASVN